jgi:hypothetical protein
MDADDDAGKQASSMACSQLARCTNEPLLRIHLYVQLALAGDRARHDHVPSTVLSPARLLGSVGVMF